MVLSLVYFLLNLALSPSFFYFYTKKIDGEVLRLCLSIEKSDVRGPP